MALAASALQALRFATFPIAGQIFFQSKLSIALVNLKPLVPGHVLVIPQRVTARFSDLRPDEVSDLFASVHKVSRAIELEHKAGAMTIAIQDGAGAGQSVPHVHVHVIPRTTGDFEPLDDIYPALEKVDIAEQHALSQRAGRGGDGGGLKVDADEDRKPRSAEEMRTEAERFTKLFPPEHRVEF
ncbi:bis(5'-adenosyl)-triphosphatase [Pseudohyphozyma bogoriensis]|nr:bis(5'-adenosyl)-triphosphatase [Pseudohyphozyma bogoriensis]